MAVEQGMTELGRATVGTAWLTGPLAVEREREAA
jgi:hypothetical protein